MELQTILSDILYLILQQVPIKELLLLSECSSFFYQRVLTSGRAQKLWEHLYKRDYSEIRLPSDGNYSKAYKEAYIFCSSSSTNMFDKGYEKMFDQTWSEQYQFCIKRNDQSAIARSYDTYFSIATERKFVDIVVRFLQMKRPFSATERDAIRYLLNEKESPAQLQILQAFLDECQLPLRMTMEIEMVLGHLETVKELLPQIFQLPSNGADLVIERAFQFHRQNITHYLHDHANKFDFHESSLVLNAVSNDDLEYIEFYHPETWPPLIESNDILETALTSGSMKVIQHLRSRGAILHDSTFHDVAHSTICSGSEGAFQALLELAGNRLTPHQIIESALVGHSEAKAALRYIRDHLDDPTWQDTIKHFEESEEDFRENIVVMSNLE